MPENVRLQNLRDFTVQIRDPENKEIVGTGIVISSDRIITCAHVVEAALGVDTKEAADRKIGVYFPQISSTETKTRYAKVESCPIKHDDDMITLRLIDGPVPLGPEQIAELGTADNSEGHEFLSYGYSPTLEYPAIRADGNILGSVEPPAGKILHADPVQISSQQIDHGMSGAAVLDTELNLVVGLVAARYFPKTWAKGDIAYAVDAKVLTFDPFFFKPREEPLPLRPAPLIRIDVSKTTESALKKLDPAWNNAPPLIQEWVGRIDLLKSITNDWISPDKRVAGLIGFGGEGKSSLARRWIDDLLKDITLTQPEGIFWWGFYDRPSVDEFFEAALYYLSGNNVDLARRYSSSSARVHLLAGMLHGGRYLFILDGLEGLQNQEGDQFGLLNSIDLREFIQFFAAPNHNSFCLVTSRVPLLDLLEYTTYQHRDVDSLSEADGRELLRKLGVKGTNGELDKAIADWGGHALTLSLVGSYIIDLYNGDILHLRDIPKPTASEPRYKRVNRILNYYDEHLSDEERAFLKIISAFRIPVDKTAFNKIFRYKPNDMRDKTIVFNTSIINLDDPAFEEMIKRPVNYRILRYDLRSGKYNTHPLIRSHYYSLLLGGDHSQAIDVHRRLKEYYLSKAKDIPANPTLDDLKPLIEAVHHACQGGDYDEAYRIHTERILTPDKVLIHNFGAYETDLEILVEFFPEEDTSKEPMVCDPCHKHLINYEVGVCLMTIGRLREAEAFYINALNIALEMNDNSKASADYRLLAELNIHLGNLKKGIKMSDCSVYYAKKAGSDENKRKRHALATKAWANHLHGDSYEADDGFNEAEELERIISGFNFLVYPHENWRPAYFLHKDDFRTARKAAISNLKVARSKSWPDGISRCYQILGDLDSEAGHYKSAFRHYNESLKIARSIGYRYVLIEALLARGRWFAFHQRDPTMALKDLNEALEYAASSGFYLYESDIRVGIALAYLSLGDKKKAKAEALHARQMSENMGYYWGKKDAYDVLAEIEKASHD